MHIIYCELVKLLRYIYIYIYIKANFVNNDFFFRILNIFNTHTRGEGRRFLKNLQWCISKRALYHFHVKYKKGSKS